MERRINKKIETHFVDFKSQIIDRLKICFGDIESDSDAYKLVEFIYNFPKIDITAEDIKKRKRVKNIVPFCDKCLALRANGEQCSRRKKQGIHFAAHILKEHHTVMWKINLKQIHIQKELFGLKKLMESVIILIKIIMFIKVRIL